MRTVVYERLDTGEMLESQWKAIAAYREGAAIRVLYTNGEQDRWHVAVTWIH